MAFVFLCRQNFRHPQQAAHVYTQRWTSGSRPEVQCPPEQHEQQEAAAHGRRRPRVVALPLLARALLAALRHALPRHWLDEAHQERHAAPDVCVYTVYYTPSRYYHKSFIAHINLSSTL